MNIINKDLSVGDVVFDQAIKEPVKVTTKNIKTLKFGVVAFQEKSNSFVFGYFTSNPIENILMCVDETSIAVAIAINKEIFKDRLVFANNIGLYKIVKSGPIDGNILLLRGRGDFPYIITRNYGAEPYLNAFAESPKLDPLFKREHKRLLKYTFGLEFETEAGYIPQELCYRYGLIPLRDGSISGVEYASIVLDNSDGLERIDAYLKLLSEYTAFNKECSYHVHMGGFPVDAKNIFALYTVWGAINDELSEILPKLAFNTAQYKSSRKDYCKRNPAIFLKFDELYHYLSGGNARFAGSLVQNHPQDVEKRAKWQIRERYWAQSLIGMCFYEGPKTVEYRMLAPTYNYRKMVFWIYMFNAIMLYAEKIARETPKNSHIPFSIYKRTTSISYMLHQVYPPDVAGRMCKMMKQLNHIVKCQAASNDLIGENISFEDSVINKESRFIIDKI